MGSVTGSWARNKLIIMKMLAIIITMMMMTRISRNFIIFQLLFLSRISQKERKNKRKNKLYNQLFFLLNFLGIFSKFCCVVLFSQNFIKFLSFFFRFSLFFLVIFLQHSALRRRRPLHPLARFENFLVNCQRTGFFSRLRILEFASGILAGVSAVFFAYFFLRLSRCFYSSPPLFAILHFLCFLGVLGSPIFCLFEFFLCVFLVFVHV